MLSTKRFLFTSLYTVTLAAANGQATYLFTRTNYIAVIPAGAFQEENGQVVMDIERAAGHADEVAEAVVEAERVADEADEAALSLGRMDELMGERPALSAAETRAALSGDSGSGLSSRLNNCANSFTAGMPVETEQGQKPIEETKIGDKVLAEDPDTGEQGYFEVVALTNHPTDEVMRVTVEAEAEKESFDITTAKVVPPALSGPFVAYGGGITHPDLLLRSGKKLTGPAAGYLRFARSPQKSSTTAPPAPTAGNAAQKSPQRGGRGLRR